MFVAKPDPALRFITPPDTLAAPVTVRPDWPVSKPADVIVPAPVVEMSPLVVTSSPAFDGESTPAARLQ
jgi:hypothetical protein